MKSLHLGMALLFIVTGCSSMPAGEKRDPATTLNPMFTTRSQNAFGTKLMHEAYKKDGSGKSMKNIMTSPISAQMAFSIALNGTDGDTRAQLLAAMNMKYPNTDSTVAAVNESNRLLQNAIAISRAEKAVEGRTNPPLVTIANSLWSTSNTGDDGKFDFAADFLSTVEKSYKPGYYLSANKLDFKDKNGSAAAAINAWVNKATNELIPTIIDAKALEPMLWVIINATYFEGSWRTPFKNTKRDFKLLNGVSEEREMIANESQFRYVKNGDAEVVELPFAQKQGDDREYAFYAILPREGTDFQKFQDNTLWKDGFTNTLIGDMNQATYTRLNVVLPKFDFDYTVEMRRGNAVTQAMGLDFLFQNSADFSKIGAKGSLKSKVDLIKQSTRIELDEFGVKAAAVTLIGGMRATSIQQPAPELVFNRPFAYAIVEKKSGAILFLGSVVDPKFTPKAKKSQK